MSKEGVYHHDNPLLFTPVIVQTMDIIFYVPLYLKNVEKHCMDLPCFHMLFINTYSIRGADDIPQCSSDPSKLRTIPFYINIPLVLI